MIFLVIIQFYINTSNYGNVGFYIFTGNYGNSGFFLRELDSTRTSLQSHVTLNQKVKEYLGNLHADHTRGFFNHTRGFINHTRGFINHSRGFIANQNIKISSNISVITGQVDHLDEFITDSTENTGYFIEDITDRTNMEARDLVQSKQTGVGYSEIYTEANLVEEQLPYRGKSKDDGSWLTINSTFISLYLFNIFWDNRQGLYSRPVLRVLGMSTTGNNVSRAEVTYKVSCHVTCEPGGEVFEVPYNGNDSVLIYQPILVHNATYERQVFVCELAGGPCERPHRAVVMAVQNPDYRRPDRLDDSNSLLVEYPVQAGAVAPFHVGVCGPLLYGSVDTYRLVEWLEMLKLLGVGRIVMHNHSMDQTMEDILTIYQTQGLVELRQVNQQGIFRLVSKDRHRDDIYALGPIVLTDCMYRNMFRFDWMAVLDLDEVILPRNHTSYRELLGELNQNKKAQSRVGYKFRHVDFILDRMLDPEPAEGVPWQMAIPRHQRRFDVMPPMFHTKSIIKPRLCTAMHYHICRGWIPNIRKASLVTIDVAMDCHYRSRLCSNETNTKQECLTALNYGKPRVDNIALPFKSGLQKAMNPQLRLLGLEIIT